MKIFLDDERKAPKGWIPVRWPQDAINLLKNNQVEIISLDHDLGNDSKGTGYDVILWIEEQVALGKMLPPVIQVHSANPSAKQKMISGINSINRLVNKINSKNFQHNTK